MNEVMTVIAIILVVFLIVFFLCACKVAGDYDRAMKTQTEKERNRKIKQKLFPAQKEAVYFNIYAVQDNARYKNGDFVCAASLDEVGTLIVEDNLPIGTYKVYENSE